MRPISFVYILALLLLPALTRAESLILIPDAQTDLTVESLPPAFYDFHPDEYWAEPEDSYWTEFSSWVLSQNAPQSENVQRLGEWADRTLSGNPRAAPNNESYLRIGFATESEYGDPAQLKPEARFRLDVPTVEEKLRLVIESESDELIPLSERRRDRQLTEDERSDTDAIGAFRFLSELGDSINLSNDVGVRLRFSPDAFWRARAKGRWQIDQHWRASVDQRIYYFHVDGWGESTWVGFDRLMFGGWLFLSASEVAWAHNDRNFELDHVFSFYKQLNNRAELNPRLGVLGESNPSLRTTNFFADLTYRYRLYEDWLYAEIIPTIEFPREYSFKDRASVIFRLELYFSGNLDL